jgi:rubrerythrin
MATGTLLPGCGGISASDFDTSTGCGDLLAGVTPSTAVDYIELRSDDVQDGRTPPGSAPDVLARRGTACSGASDKPRCEAALRALRPTKLQSPKAIDHFDGRYLAFTRGDEVAAVTTLEELKTFLAPFETPNDGVLLLSEFSEHRLACDGANTRPAGDAFEFRTETGYACGEGTHTDAHVVRVARNGDLSVRESDRLEDGDSNCAIGRRPEGYAPTAGARSIGEYLATAAELEAASVPAFRRLAAELRAHGAPEELVSRAESAARDEIRHARETRRLARRFGAKPSTPRVGKLPIRALRDIAMENAREGCVRETFGALVATVQAARAEDAEVRTAMQSIALDETEHAALAWDIAQWLDANLDETARREVQFEREAAAVELRAALGRPSFASPLLGLPSPREAIVLFDSLHAALAA